MSLANFSLASLKNQFDEVRAQVYPKNETERKVYEALSSKNWGASSTLLADIASETGDYEKFSIIMEVIWNSLEVEGRSWKQLFKALTLIEFLIKNGSERCVEVFRDRVYKIRTLEHFNCYEAGVDKGSGVREKSKQVVELLGNNETIRSEREKARNLRNKFVGISNDGRNSGFGGGGNYSGGNDSRDNYSSGRYNDSGSSWNNNSGGGVGNSFSSGGGRGGDTSRAGKFSDDYGDSYGDGGHSQSIPPRARKEEVVEEEVEDVQIKMPSKAGKLKVAIKKDTKKSEVVKAKVPEVDLFSFDAEPVAQTSSTTTTTNFDPFGPAPVTATTSFDPFGSSAPAPPVPSSADPFGASVFSAAAPVAPQQTAFDPFSAGQFQATTPAVPMQQHQFQQPMMPMQQQQFQQPMMPMQQQQFQQPAMSMQQQQFQQPMMPMQSQQQFQQPGARIALTLPPVVNNIAAQPTTSAEFGDFESAPAKSAPAKWNDLGSLVNLGSITLNDDPKAKPNAAHTQQSFAGLDGFTKSQQSAGGSIKPQGQGMASASMLAPPAQPAMMVRQPIGLAPGMSSLAPPQMAPSMGQGMYGAPTMGMGNMYPPQQMGGGPPQQMGGGMYPGANMPMQPPPGGFQPQQNGYGGFPPSGYPPRGPGMF